MAEEVVRLDADAIAAEVREALRSLTWSGGRAAEGTRPLSERTSVPQVRILPAPSKQKQAVALLARVASIEQRLAVLKQAQPEHNAKVEAFAALLLSLWSRLQSHELTTDAYLTAVGDAYDNAVGTVPDVAKATLDRLRQTALDRASNAADTARLPDDHEDAPSDAQRGSMAHGVAGALWAGLLAVGAYTAAEQSGEDAIDIYEWQAQDDPATCPDCEALDGQQFTLDEIPFWPAEGDFDENTQCGPACRCELTATANDRTNAPVQSAVKPQMVKDAKCPVCGRWLGRNVNVGATLHCPKHNEVTIG